ncbi:uncharacterized protein LOC141902811 [Tubulanus polymorphus]|uniref:uncharacterized protein LOC141902811 n=1 Tax=Tubulanus polymorphus TaxID=672921 RepID=UPI003DA515E3
MADTGQVELLFFDTFQHENNDDINLDLVQFQHPVLIHDVRIIPLGVKVVADVPGAARLGATNPSSFKLEMYVNNLMKPNAATFEKLGVLDYQGDRDSYMQFDTQRVATDGLILKGWYSMLTVAVFGSVTHVAKDRNSPPPPPPPQRTGSAERQQKVSEPVEKQSKTHEPVYHLEQIEISHDPKTATAKEPNYAEISQPHAIHEQQVDASYSVPAQSDTSHYTVPAQSDTSHYQQQESVKAAAAGDYSAESERSHRRQGSHEREWEKDWERYHNRSATRPKSPRSPRRSPRRSRSGSSRSLSPRQRSYSRSPRRSWSRSPRRRGGSRSRSHSPPPHKRRSKSANRSPGRDSNRDQSPGLASNRTVSPAAERARSPGRARSPDSKRARTPPRESSKTRSPGKDGNRGHSPGRDSDRTQSPDGVRGRSPARDSNRRRSPGRGDKKGWSPGRSPDASARDGRIRSPDQNILRSPGKDSSRIKSPGREIRTRSPERFRGKSPEKDSNRGWSPDCNKPRSPRRDPQSRSPGKDAAQRIRSPGRDSERGQSPIGISNRARSPGSNRARSPGSNRARSPGSNRARSPGSNRARSPGSNRARSPGSNRARSPGSNRARSPGSNRARSPGSNRARSPSSNRARSPGSNRGMSPGGSVKPRSPSDRRAGKRRSPIGRRPRSPGGSRAQSPGSSRTHSPGGARIRSPGRRSWSPTGRLRSPGMNRPWSPGGNRPRSPGERRAWSPSGGRPRSPGSSRTRSPGGSRAWSPGSSRPRSPGRSPAVRSRNSPGRWSRSPGSKRGRSPDTRNRSPGRRSRSPGSAISRSRSPRQRSRSPGSRLRSPNRRSRSPGGRYSRRRRSRSRSVGRPRSPGSRPRSPGSRPRSPRRRSRSPSGRAGSRVHSPDSRPWSPGYRGWSSGRPRSPGRRSFSPGGHRSRSPRGRSPRRGSRSPSGRMCSPLSRSPSGRPRSPGGRPRSPGGRPRSPGGRPRSPGGRPRSPGGRMRSPGSRGHGSRPRSPVGLGWPQQPPMSPSGRPISPTQWPIPAIRSQPSPGRSRSPGPPFPRMMRVPPPPQQQQQQIQMDVNAPYDYRHPYDPYIVPPEHQPIQTVGDGQQAPTHLSMPPVIQEIPIIQPTPAQHGINQFDALSADEEGIDVSEGELPEMEGGGYEEILSDEDIMSDVDENELQRMQDMDIEIPDDLMWNYTYNPYQFELNPLTSLVSPELTSYQVEIIAWTQKGCTPDVPTEATQILEIINLYKTEPHHAAWIEAMELLPQLLSVGLSYLLLKEKREDVVDLLVDWIIEGLDIEKAMLQPDRKYILRHLKMGIKLAGVFSACDYSITAKMMKRETQHKLLDLYLSENMSISLKIQILRALDLTTRFQLGIQWFLGLHPLQQTDVQYKQTESAYQKLVKIMLSKQLVRAMVSISPLIRKMHVFELIGKFQFLTEKLIESADVESEKTAAAPEGGEEDLDGITQTVSDAEAEPIVNTLDEIIGIHANAKYTIAQPRRTLVAKVQVAVSKESYDPYPNLYEMFESGHLLESVFMLITAPSTFNHSGIFTIVKDILQQLMSTMEGLRYLATRTELTNGIIRNLTQAQESSDEPPEETPANLLGLQLIYSMQVLQALDRLTEFHQKDVAEKLIDDPEILSMLHTLFMMTFSAQGRECVVHVLSQANNLDVLIPLVEIPEEDSEAMIYRLKKSVNAMYVSHLLVIVVRETVNMNLLEKYAATLLKLSDVDLNSKLNELQEWLAPTRRMCDYTYESLPVVLTSLKQYNDEITELPRGLITTLKILQHWAIAPSKQKTCGRQELKYKIVIAELFSAECMQIFTNILQKITDLIRRPWQQGSYLSIGKGLRATAMIKPTIALMKAMQCSFIHSRGAECKDVSHLAVLFEVHTVMCSAPPTGQLAEQMQVVQKNILETLLAYTQPALEQSENALSESLWKKMLDELLKYTLTSPYTAVSGLIMLSELLPLPLPLQTKEGLTDEEVAIATNTRKLWSAHILCCKTKIHEIIKSLATSSCVPLQNVLRRVCWQIADMSAPSAQVIAKSLLECLVESWGPTPAEVPKDATKETEPAEPLMIKPASSDTAQLFTCLAHLVAHPSIKMTVIDMITPGIHSEPWCATVLTKLLVTMNIPFDRPSHLQAQECIVSILQSICDPEISILPPESVQEPELLLSSSIPCRELLNEICNGLLIHTGHIDHNYASILLALRTLVMLLEHDYGFTLLKQCLGLMPGIFFNLFMRINNTFSKDSSDCLSTLSTATEFLRLLVTIDNDEEQTLIRTKTMTVPEIQNIISWTPENAYEHPLTDLERLLVDCVKEDENKDEEMLESLLEGTQTLLQIVRTEDSTEKKDDDEENAEIPVLPDPIPVSIQFTMRPIYTITDNEDDRLNFNYWLNYPVDDSDSETELIRCDFEDMCHKFYPDFDLKAELLKGSLSSDAHKPKKKQRNARHRDTINTSSTRGRGRRQAFIAPMRGRGFGRGSQSSRPNDPFRSRPPNTSRPPSMHVDDFVKFEGNGGNGNNGGGAGGGSGGKEFSGGRGGGGRGRNFDRVRGGGGGGGRGRFFSPPGVYGRRDTASRNGRGGSDRGPGRGGGQTRGGGANGSRGSPGAGQWGGRSKQLSPRGFNGGRGRDGDRMGSGDRRGVRDNPRFGRGGGGGNGGRGRGQWGSPRKESDSRFAHPLPPGGSFRGGRRDEMRGGRHMRSYTK